MSSYYVPSRVDLSDDYSVLAGTIYGEIRGGIIDAKQNVAQVLINRKNHKAHATFVDVCLAPKQFSCWNYSDPNRAEIMAAPQKDPRTWAVCCQVAWDALHGVNPNRIQGAMNYYATWLSPAPPWAKPPAVVTLNDGFHIFVRL